ncbi:hypothetical protein [Vibrio scophthalmi]|uniref:Uncharacterized protein n=1 Tax=Vibrio scophthalmi TaxID=45658 RepID=A0A1E3WJY5_9VIBR|nr:hypothetical protein [Vibrio scophthalmi]ODS09827.1 hypothetical protein VSF3289_00058 [Vibrio scophthalmi]
MEVIEVLAVALITGLSSSLATVAALKTEINWIKNTQRDQESRIRKLEGKQNG